MVAEQHSHPPAGILRLLLKLVEEPVYLHHIVSTIEYVAYYHELVAAIRPFQVFVYYSVGGEKVYHAVHPPVRVRHHEEPPRLADILPLLP